MARTASLLFLLLLPAQDPKPPADPPVHAEVVAYLERSEREIRDLAGAIRTEFLGNADFDIPREEFEARVAGALRNIELGRSMLQDNLKDWRNQRKEPNAFRTLDFNKGAAQQVRSTAQPLLSLHLCATELRIALLRRRGEILSIEVSRNDGLENQAIKERFPVVEERQAFMKELEARRRLRLQEAERAYFQSTLETYRRLKASLVSTRIRIVTELWRFQEKYVIQSRTEWPKTLESFFDPLGQRRAGDWGNFENASLLRCRFLQFTPPADAGPELRKLDAEWELGMGLASWIPAIDLRPKLPPARLHFELKAGDRFDPVPDGDVLPMGVDLVVVAEFEKSPVPDRVAVAVDSGAGRISVDVARTAEAPVRFRSAPFRLKAAP